LSDRDPAPMSITVIRPMRKGWRSEEATIRFMIDAVRGVDPFGGNGSLIESA
jgi:isocitrate dehydrogenase